jgi:hypothetical protein
MGGHVSKVHGLRMASGHDGGWKPLDLGMPGPMPFGHRDLGGTNAGKEGGAYQFPHVTPAKELKSRLPACPTATSAKISAMAKTTPTNEGA